MGLETKGRIQDHCRSYQQSEDFAAFKTKLAEWEAECVKRKADANARFVKKMQKMKMSPKNEKTKMSKKKMQRKVSPKMQRKYSYDSDSSSYSSSSTGSRSYSSSGSSSYSS